MKVGSKSSTMARILYHNLFFNFFLNSVQQILKYDDCSNGFFLFLANICCCCENDQVLFCLLLHVSKKNNYEKKYIINKRMRPVWS